MVDAWEIMGRLATDDGFRGTLFNAKFNSPYKTDSVMRADIDDRDYATALAIVRTVQKDRPVSLMALGDILLALTNWQFKWRSEVLSDAIKATGLPVSGKDGFFYVALGVMVIDERLQVLLQASPAAFDAFGFPAVSSDDRALLGQLFNAGDPKGKAVVAAAKSVCDSNWEPGCLLRAIYWEGHLHPVANP